MNFYTSSSRYLIVLGVLFAVYLAFSIWTNIYVEAKGLAKDNERLLFVQLDKIKNTKGVEIAFVGDSSLGNSIDAKLVEKLTGKKTLNLALTGAFGYSGSYNMAQQVYELNKSSLSYLIIMQTLDVASRALDADLYRKSECINCGDSFFALLSNFADKDFFSAYQNSWINAYMNLNYITSRAKKINSYASDTKELKAVSEYDAKVDYYAQNIATGNKQSKIEEMKIKKLPIPQVQVENMRYLEHLKNFCLKRKIKCIYLHGPIYQTLGQRYKGYQQTLDKEIKNNFVAEVRGGPYLMNPKQVGDTLDHIRPSFKKQSTLYYLKIIFPDIRE